MPERSTSALNALLSGQEMWILPSFYIVLPLEFKFRRYML